MGQGMAGEAMEPLNVLIRCSHCSLNFPSPFPIPDAPTYHLLAATVTPLKCSLCDRFNSVTGENMFIVPEESDSETP
jgi:hypothetical protein